jgi:hypothetical protein
MLIAAAVNVHLEEGESEFEFVTKFCSNHVCVNKLSINKQPVRIYHHSSSCKVKNSISISVALLCFTIDSKKNSNQ